MENSIYIIGEALKNYISQASSILDHEINLALPQKRWVTSPSTTTPKVNIYLFEIRENLELRENEWQSVHYSNGSVHKKRPDVRIDLFYIMTFYGQTPESPDALITAVKEEQKYLSEVLSIVYNHDHIPKEFFRDGMGNLIPNIPDIPITVARPKNLESDGAMQLWSAIEQYIKPAIYLKVTIPVNLKQQIEETMVFSKIFKYGFYIDNNYIPIEDKNISFAGIITDIATSPIMGATVKLYTTEKINGVDTKRLIDTYSTNKKGQFIFWRLNEQSYQIEVSATEQGYKSTTRDFINLLKIEKKDCIIALESAT